MHAACATFVAQAIERHDKFHGGPFASVLEIGARDVNGGVRSLFGPCEYTTLDIEDGPGVDIVADARHWTPSVGVRFDVIVCTNVLEHVHDWHLLIDQAAEALMPGGWLIVTTVGDPFPPHSAVDGGALRPGEYYGNVDAWKLLQACGAAGLYVEAIHAIPPEVQIVGVKR